MLGACSVVSEIFTKTHSRPSTVQRLANIYLSLDADANTVFEACPLNRFVLAPSWSGCLTGIYWTAGTGRDVSHPVLNLHGP
jgi:hypothetical protein